MGQHLAGIGGIGIGLDDLASRQRRDGRGQLGIGQQRRKVDVMHIGQIRMRVDPVFGHQPGQGRATVSYTHLTLPTICSV